MVPNCATMYVTPVRFASQPRPARVLTGLTIVESLAWKAMLGLTITLPVASFAEALIRPVSPTTR